MSIRDVRGWFMLNDTKSDDTFELCSQEFLFHGVDLTCLRFRGDICHAILTADEYLQAIPGYQSFGLIEMLYQDSIKSTGSVEEICINMIDYAFENDTIWFKNADDIKILG